MRLIAEERLLRFVFPALAAALIAPLPQVAWAADTAWRDQGEAASPARNAGSADIRHEIADRARNDLRVFYAARGYAPLWLDASGLPSAAATTLWLRMKTADRDGIDPHQFDLDKLSNALDRARDGDAADKARAELALSST